VTEHRILWASIKDPGTIIGELPIETVSWSKWLNAPGAIAGVVPLDPYGAFSRAQTRPLYPTSWYQPGDDDGKSVYLERPVTRAEARALAKSLFGPGSFGTARTVLYVERDGVIQKGGILWGNQASVSNDSLTFSGEGWHSYTRLRTIQQTLIYSGGDQDEIARALIFHMQIYGGGNLGITTSINNHGVTRDRTYPWHDGKFIGEAIEDLTQLENGFDFDYVSSYDSNGEIETAFVTRYPSSGRETEIVFELGTNVSLVDFTEDGKGVVTQQRVFGAGFGQEVKTATASNGAAFASYPLIEGRSTYPDVVRQTTLDDYAAKALARGSEPPTFITLQVFPDQIPRMGSYEVGDRVKVTVDYGYLQLDLAPYRIVGHEVDVSQEGGEVSTVTLSPLALFT